MCIFLLMLFAGPRVASIFWLIFDPNRWSNAFDNVIWPVLGFILVPWTTLAFVIVEPGGITTFDGFVLLLSFMADVATYVGGRWSGIDQPDDNLGAPERSPRF